ncbi:putative transmembrane protein. transcriptional regulator, AraC family [Tenacibaculum sp. 190524A05c]
MLLLKTNTNPLKEFFLFILYSGITLNVLLIFLVLNRIKKQPINKVLVLILSCLLILFLMFAFNYMDNKKLTRLLVPVGSIIYMALGPMLLHYIKSVYENLDFKKLYKSLIPFFIAILIYSIPSYFLETIDSKNELSLVYLIFIVPFLGWLYFIYCLYQCFQILKKYRLEVRNNYSFTKNIDLKWLSIWVNGFIVFIFVDLISGGVLLTNTSLKFILILNLTYLTSLIWYMGYYGLNQTQVFLFQEISQKPAKPQQKQITQDLESLKNLEDKFELLFTKNQLFKEQNLTLLQTAKELEISDKKLSNFLNSHLQTTFYDYVNSHRIEYFKKSIQNGKSNHLTLLAIAFDSGFNSKATFNRVFKQKEGMTPFQFKKQFEKGLTASNEAI